MPQIARFALAAAVAAAFTPAPFALAQSRVPPPPGYYQQAMPAQNAAATCRPMCPSDFAPCDPIYFKTADQRCNRTRLEH